MSHSRSTPSSPNDIARRIETLQRISGLTVTQRERLGVNYFNFVTQDGRTLKTVCTYRKAKAFAEGVAIGRSLPH